MWGMIFVARGFSGSGIPVWSWFANVMHIFTIDEKHVLCFPRLSLQSDDVCPLRYGTTGGPIILLVQSKPRAFIFPLIFFAERRCSFPEEWRGKWYQNGLGSVNLTQHTMTKKGTCHINHDDNKYVVYNKWVIQYDINCCVLFVFSCVVGR
jgi:hypothetical protein